MTDDTHADHHRMMSPEGSHQRRPILWSNVLFFAAWTLATVIAVPWYAVTVGVTWVDIAALVTLWVVTGLSITAGYHRLFAHRAYTASAPVRWFFALFGAAAWQSSIITWSAHHRFHHRFVDTDQDPYNAKEGFWYSHIGWLLVEAAKHDDLSNVPDLWKDPICRSQHRVWIPIAIIVNVLVVIALGLLTGHMVGMIVFALLLRVVVVHHTTWLINSAAHAWGSRHWSTRHTARDNWALSLLTFGEGYHNYHHTFQADYRNGPFWHNWDPSKWLIWTLARLRLADKLRRTPVDVTLGRRFEQARRELDAAIADLGDRARTAVASRLAPIETRFEEALERLKAARENVQAAARDTEISPRELRRAVWRARRSARRALRHWRAATRSCLAELVPAAQAP
jgi:stearoyl-CoA desaturase (delta-9 desaturase)